MEAQTAIITGSTSGIGLQMARKFAAKGYNVIFNGLEADGAQTAQKVADEFGVEYLFSDADMAKPEALRNLVKEVSGRFPTVDVLINNAGIQYVSPIEEFPENRWDEIIAVNLSASFHLIKAVWPFMKKTKLWTDN